MKHTLKIQPQYFSAVQSGAKPFEIRKNDCGFKVGDVLELEEWEPCSHCEATGKVFARPNRFPLVSVECHECSGSKGHYTGQSITRRVTYILEGMGIEKGHLCMGLEVGE